MQNHKRERASNHDEIIMFSHVMSKAYWLKTTLNSIELKIAVNSKGKEFIKPDIFNPKLPQIIREVTSFAKDIKSLPFEIPLFDDDMFCTEYAIIDTINRGVYNVASLCYNKAVLTIYDEISNSYSEHAALSVLGDASSIYDRLDKSEL